MKEVLNLAADFIAKVGFPIFVAVLLLWREDSRHSENIAAMRELILTIKDQHLAIHCKAIADRQSRQARPRRPKDKRR